MAVDRVKEGRELDLDSIEREIDKPDSEPFLTHGYWYSDKPHQVLRRMIAAMRDYRAKELESADNERAAYERGFAAAREMAAKTAMDENPCYMCRFTVACGQCMADRIRALTPPDSIPPSSPADSSGMCPGAGEDSF